MRISNFLLLASSFTNQVLAWGDLGHRTVALLAQKYLTADAQQLLDSILENDFGYDFSDAATWADTVKRKRPETKVWHYVDAMDSPPTKCGLTYPKDCAAQGKDGCIITAISNQTSMFLDPDTGATPRREALMFLMHLIGDLHQPLHVEDAYRGGNDIDVCFVKACANNNLHSVWDKYIPHKIIGLKNSASNEEEKLAAAEWAGELFELNEEAAIDATAECADVNNPTACVLGWARESNAWICKYVLKQSVKWLETNDLSKTYYEGAVPIVETLVGKGGARLGAWLNALAANAPLDVWREAGLPREDL